jgi:cephalosporin hydroxylase
MKIAIDEERRELTLTRDGKERTLPLYSREAFEALSEIWLKVGWNEKYPYTFSWLGRPIIQAPEDVLRAQEVFYRVKPDLLIETGVAHGGSLVFYASLCEAIGRGRIVGVDIEIRPHNRKAIEAHRLFSRITLIESDSIAPATVSAVKSHVAPGECVMVVLDSNHTKAHVRAELDAYAPLVTPGSYVVVTDGSMQVLHDVPRGQRDWVTDNPAAAAREFAAEHPEFVLEQPAWLFNESALQKNITHWPDAWLRRLTG